MSGFLIAFTGMIYLYVAIEQLYSHKNIGMFIAYLGYAFANIGLYLLASK
jgi:hypothetical protein